MKVLFASVIFPASKPFLYDFLVSIDRQCEKNFDLLIINDGIDITTVNGLLLQFPELRIVFLDNKRHYSPSGLRIQLMMYAKEKGYDLLIIGDSDDTFSTNRISNVIDSFCERKAAFYYNALIRESGDDVFGDMPGEVSDFRDVGEYNFVGLSMLAVDIEKVSNEFICSLNEYKGNVFDWYLVSRMLLDNKRGIYVPQAWTKYRIHENNYIGVAGNTAAEIRKEIKVKQFHYGILSRYSDYYKRLYEAYSNNEYTINTDNNLHHYWWGITRRN